MGDHRTIDPERRLWRIWHLLVFVMIINVAVLMTAQLLLYSGFITNDWPWPNTHISLIAVLAAANAGLIIYLTLQKRDILAMQRHIRSLERDATERLGRNAARLLALTSVSGRMCAETDPEKIFKYITNTCVEIFGCDRASLMHLDADSEELVVRAVSPAAESGISGIRQKVGCGIAGYAAKTREPVLLRRDTDLSGYEWFGDGFDKSMSAMVVPIILRGELVGVINVSTVKEHIEYDDEDVSALKIFADNAGAFIRHSEQAEWMRKTIERLGNSPGRACGVTGPS